MAFAAGPWHHPPQLPDEGRTLCVVRLRDAQGATSHQVLRYLRGRWTFEDGTALSRSLRVEAWAYLTPSIARLSEADFDAGEALPAESRLFDPFHLTGEENVRLLVAYIQELKGEVAVLTEALRLAREQLIRERAEGRIAEPLEVAHLRSQHQQQLERRNRNAAQVRERVAALEQELGELQRSGRMLRADNDLLNARYVRAEAEVGRLRQQLKELQARYNQLKSRPRRV